MAESLNIEELQGSVAKINEDVVAAIRSLGRNQDASRLALGSALIEIRDISRQLALAARDDFDDWGNLDGG